VLFHLRSVVHVTKDKIYWVYVHIVLAAKISVKVIERLS